MTRLVDLFAASVARHGGQPAVDVPPGAGRPERVVVSYTQLAAMAAQVATALAPHVREEALVVVLLGRTSPWLYATWLGAMQAGAGYVCVDPTFPDAHLAHVAADAKAVAVVTDATGAGRAGALGLPVVMLPLAASAPAAATSTAIRRVRASSPTACRRASTKRCSPRAARLRGRWRWREKGHERRCSVGGGDG